MLGRSINRKRHWYFTRCGRKLNLLKDVLEMLLMLPEIIVLYFFTCISHAFFLTIFVFYVTEDVFIIFKQNIAKWGTRKKCSHILKKSKKSTSVDNTRLKYWHLRDFLQSLNFSCLHKGRSHFLGNNFLTGR